MAASEARLLQALGYDEQLMSGGEEAEISEAEIAQFRSRTSSASSDASSVPGAACPRKMGLNWFIPAFAKSSVGSLSGTTPDDATRVCPRFSAK